VTRAKLFMRTRCPFCRVVLDGVSEKAGLPVTPSDGDVSFCIECGEWSVYQLDGHDNLRRPTFAEYQEIVDDMQLRLMRLAWVKAFGPAGPRRKHGNAGTDG
jgi:hypothetical protein